MIYTCAGDQIQEEGIKSTLTDLRDENALQQVTDSISNELGGGVSDSSRIQWKNVLSECRAYLSTFNPDVYAPRCVVFSLK